MISQVLALIMVTTAAPADKINIARRAYANCLNALIKTELDAKTDVAGFDGKIAAACKSEETAFRNAIVTVDVAAGIKRSDAEGNATTEIGDFIGQTKESYKDYVETKTRPG